MLTELRERERLRLGRAPTPSEGVMDSQSVRATERGGLHGYDGGKKVNGTKRHVLVDTLGTVLLACVSPANVDDRDGAEVLLRQAADNFPRLKHVWADQGYRGADFHTWIRQATGITVQIVQRRDGGFRHTWAKVGAPTREVPYFAVVPRRWVVEDAQLADALASPGARLRDAAGHARSHGAVVDDHAHERSPGRTPPGRLQRAGTAGAVNTPGRTWSAHPRSTRRFAFDRRPSTFAGTASSPSATASCWQRMPSRPASDSSTDKIRW
ncbi:transposase [Streptomyces sp. NPDC048527]|uniref:transposase n=1 Tax=Streptomyces sp. NPDC048527 TaxID=3365568 RepID=UPI00371C8E6F